MDTNRFLALGTANRDGTAVGQWAAVGVHSGVGYRAEMIRFFLQHQATRR